jgi:methylated-DNA-protein-cysteine methyltransferase related protein
MHLPPLRRVRRQNPSTIRYTVLMPPSNYSKIYATIRRIPFGKVASYGQIAEVAGLPRQARLVGYALFQQKVDDDLPWHRVVNAQGSISYSPARQQADHLQRVLLEAEGVVFNGRGRIDLKQYRWKPQVRSRKTR